MPYKVFGSEVLTSADVMTFFMRQANIICTSSTRPASPVDGMLIYETDSKRTVRYDGGTSTWRTWPDSPVEASDATNITGITSTSYIAGSPSVSLTFVGPPSGKGFVTVSGNIEGGASENTTFLSYEIRLTNVSGTVTQATSDNNAVATQGVDNLKASYRSLVTGLTPGQTYFVRTMHRVTTVGGVFHRHLLWEPAANA